MQLEFWKHTPEKTGRAARSLPSLPLVCEPVPKAAELPLQAGQQDVPVDSQLDGLHDLGRFWCGKLGLHSLAERLKITWNPRLSSTAGLAFPGAARIELNPLLVDFPGEVNRTFLHELAHLIANERSGRRRVAAHGPEWKKACHDIGIPEEKSQHRLALPRRSVTRRFFYQCPNCRTLYPRVRRLPRRSACANCCREHNGGEFDERFVLIRVTQPPEPHPQHAK